MNHCAQMGKRVALILVASLLLLASSPLAAAEWTQTDWSGGETTEVVTGTTTKYRTGENENVLAAGKIILENQTLVAESKLPTTSGKSSGFIDNDNVLTSNDLYAKGTGVAGWVDHIVISEVDGVTDNVELYNPTSYSIGIAGWVLDTPTDTDADATLPAGATIAPHGFYLVGDAGADHNEVITIGTTNSWVRLRSSSLGPIIDIVGWGTAAENEGTATTLSADNLERKAQSSSTATSMANGDSTKGNGYDTDNNANDFVQRSTSGRQTTASAAEHPGWLTENDNIWAGGFATGTDSITGVKLKVEYKVSAAWDNDDLIIKYSLDGGATFGATSSTITPSSTTDTTATVDVSTDRTWTWTDITNLRIYVIYNIDNPSDGKDVLIDAMWVEVIKGIGPYKPFAYLESSVFDAGANADWKTVSWNSITPAQTDENVYLRSGSDNNPDDGWSGWYLHDNDSENASLPNNRYVQYRIQLSTDNENRTPEFLDITINYNAFSITASPSSVTVVLGTDSSTTLTLTLRPGSGSVGSVSLSGSWVGASTPTGVTGSFNPTSVTPDADGKTSTLTFTAESNATTGSYTYRVSGTSGDLTQTLDIPVAVAAFDYSVSAFPDNLSMVRGETKTSTIRVSQVSGKPGPVSLSGAWVGYEAGKGPTGITAELRPTSGTPTFESTLTVLVDTNAEGGSFLYRVTGTGGGITREANVRVTVNVGLTLTLTTDKDNYKKGDSIRVEGTARDPKGNLVENGTATIRFAYENWSRIDKAKIKNGAYSYNYQISFGDPDGTWIITVTAVDNANNTERQPATKSIDVGTPPGVSYYPTSIQLTTGVIYSRGDRIQISVTVKDNSGTLVENMYIYLKLPSGREIPMRSLSPGVYITENTLGWDEPTGIVNIRIGGEKAVGAEIYHPGDETATKEPTINIEIKPATLLVSLLSPVGRVEVGESVKIRVKVYYPNEGGPVESAVVTVSTPSGESLTLAHEGSGIYSTTYTVTSQDLGSWSLGAAASDPYGNSGTKTTALEVAPTGVGGILAAYWWAFLAIFATVGVSSAYLGWRMMLVRKLKAVRKEMREIPKLRKEAMIKYFKEGSIERDTYDELMDKYDMRLGELRKQEELLGAKVGKKVKAKKARRKRR